jgi:site-specific DNA recombinase
VTIHSVLERLDGSPESVIMETLLEGMAQYYSLNLAREVLKGQREAAFSGKQNLGGMPPLGYNINKESRKYEINEDEARIVRIIFEKYASGIGYNTILEYLNGMDYRTKRGRPFAKNGLHSILHNEKYTGVYIFNKKLEKDVSGKRRPQVKPESEWVVIEDGVPAIVDKDTFNRVQIKLAENQNKCGRFKAKEVYLLSGLIQCG